MIKGLLKAYLDYRSFKTNRKLFVIESDDWGSIRTSNRKILNKLNKLSLEIQADPYIQFDNIASSDDLSALFDVLNSVKDLNGNPACMTANVCTANPDFNAIKSSNFEKFYFKKFTETLQDFSFSESLINLWRSGENDKLFSPQLHGREHVHALAWLKELQLKNTILLKAFNLQNCSVPCDFIQNQKRRNFQAALDLQGIDGEEQFQRDWVLDSAEIFNDTFGYYAKTFIAPAYIWNNQVNYYLSKANVKSLQGLKIQYIPKKTKMKFSKKLRYTGEIDKRTNLIYSTRNCFFEPSLKPHFDWISKALNGVEKAFQTKQPAIIGSHRLNFIGNLNESNRKNNLKMLKELLYKVLKKYPDVEFISSSQLSDIFSENNNLNHN